MRCYHPFWIEHSKENCECEASAYNRHLAFNPLPVRGGEEIRRPRLHPPSSNFRLRCASTRRVGATRRRIMKRILHLNLRRKFFAAAASIPSCCRRSEERRVG